MEKKDRKEEINRREFLKRLGVGAAASTISLAGCNSRNNVVSGNRSAQGEIPTDKMTYRTNPKTGDKVSLLGYGCMRWPDTSGGAGRNPDADLDQETINRLVDTAIAHGVNYFDTSPAYCMGRSERATGIALKRHPRNTYFLQPSCLISPLLHGHERLLSQCTTIRLKNCRWITSTICCSTGWGWEAE